MRENNFSARRRHRSERDQLELFRTLPGDLAARDEQDLMAYPFFSLAKSKRIVPIDFRAGTILIRMEAAPEHGMATIWDADVLIWTASQIVEARDDGLKTSRLMAATPYEILTFVGRSTSLREYDRLKAALDRLQSTTGVTSVRQPAERRRHRFCWINQWKETADGHGKPRGLELILPDWFYAGVLNDALVLTIDRGYFDLTGGLERRLYRLVRKHGGRQGGGWSFDVVHLHAKSGSLSSVKHFAYDLRQISFGFPSNGPQPSDTGQRYAVDGVACIDSGFGPQTCLSSNLPNDCGQLPPIQLQGRAINQPANCRDVSRRRGRS